MIPEGFGLIIVSYIVKNRIGEYRDFLYENYEGLPETLPLDSGVCTTFPFLDRQLQIQQVDLPLPCAVTLIRSSPVSCRV